MKIPNDSTVHAPSDFYAVDLHVHTPHSGDYRGEVTDEEYISLLKMACQHEVRVIAIGDHNTFKGYYHLLELKARFHRDLESLLRYADSAEAVEELTNKIDLFSNILILPSVELEIKPGVHMIFVFDDATPMEELERFIQNAGVRADDMGKPVLETVLNYDLETAMQSAAELGGMAIAAHADSDKGIYNVLSGVYRASVFTSEYLYAICFNNARQKDLMRSLLRNREYRRSTELSFIQVSDFHNSGQIIGQGHTYVKLPTIDFFSLKTALRNPDECVSWPERPETMMILQGLIAEDRNVRLSHLSTDVEREQFCHALCALSNCADGTIIIGATPDGNLVGVPEYEIGDDLLYTFAESYVSPPPTYAITRYPFGDKCVIAVRVTKGPATVYSSTLDGHFYILVEGQINVASALEMAKLVEDNLIKKSVTLLSASRSRLDAIAQTLSQHYDALEALAIARKIERASLPLGQIMKHELLFQTLDFAEAPSIASSVKYNGLPSGNIILVGNQLPRLEDSYIRFTGVKTQADNDVLKKAGVLPFDGEKIIIAPGGAIYYDNTDGVYIISREYPIPVPAVLLTVSSIYKDAFPARFVLGWLKSSIPLWYAASNFNTIDLHRGKICLSLPLPVNVPDDIQRDVCALVDDMLDLEVKHLTEEVKVSERLSQILLPSEDSDVERFLPTMAELLSLVANHNRKAAKLMTSLDAMFSELYSLTREDTALIRRALHQHRLCCFYGD